MPTSVPTEMMERALQDKGRDRLTLAVDRSQSFRELFFFQFSLNRTVVTQR